MPAIIVLVVGVVLVLVALAVASFIAHLFFSPWLLLLAAVAVLGWFKVRRRRVRR